MLRKLLPYVNRQISPNFSPKTCALVNFEPNQLIIRNLSFNFQLWGNEQFARSKLGIPSLTLSRNYCSSSNEDRSETNIASYAEVKEIGKHPEKVLIDVREPEELKETGRIPYSINIPLGDVVTYLSFETPDDKFSKKFGRQKPSNKTPIIFYCKIGKRSQIATDSARQLGFQNVKNYKGSWLEWEEREGLSKNN